jgi:hypothetical protein
MIEAGNTFAPQPQPQRQSGSRAGSLILCLAILAFIWLVAQLGSKPGGHVGPPQQGAKVECRKVGAATYCESR